MGGGAGGRWGGCPRRPQGRAQELMLVRQRTSARRWSVGPVRDRHGGVGHYGGTPCRRPPAAFAVGAGYLPNGTSSLEVNTSRFPTEVVPKTTPPLETRSSPQGQSAVGKR